MRRLSRRVLPLAAVALLLAPVVASGDALPPDKTSIYYHCTPDEQCPQGSETCTALSKGAGRKAPDDECATAATGRGLEQRCYGPKGFLFCPKGATGSWKGKPAETAPAEGAPRHGCSR